MSEEIEDGDEGMPDGAIAPHLGSIHYFKDVLDRIQARIADHKDATRQPVELPAAVRGDAHSRRQLLTAAVKGVLHDGSARDSQVDAMITSVTELLRRSSHQVVSPSACVDAALELVSKVQPGLTSVAALQVLDLIADFIYSYGTDSV